MTPIPFSQMVEWILEEEKSKGAVVGTRRPYRADKKYNGIIFGCTLEISVGPAAGPHTQLTQNIVAAYHMGSRFFELKTVQVIDGEDLPVSKPCIEADDERHNCEWSTELYVPQVQKECIKAWSLLHVLAEEYGLGGVDGAGFQPDMGIGYDLKGIKSPKTDSFTKSTKDASGTEAHQACRQYLLGHVGEFKHVTKEDIENIPPNICNSVTLSTLYGCPPQEIERITIYLIEEKGLYTLTRCNPTLLGYEFARETMDWMGYDYVALGDFHFLDDLQYENAISMLKRLTALADGKNLEFGVKITNIFPVDVKQNELPSEETHMPGKSLYPLSISLATKLAKEFDGKLCTSCSGGADFFDIKEIVDAGIWPVTVVTTLLKSDGYQKMSQMAELVQEENGAFEGASAEKIAKLAENVITDKHHAKDIKPLPPRKIDGNVPLADCFFAPCKEGCLIHQDIITYLQLAGAGKYEEAIKAITEKNSLPFITGTICAHNCMNKCNRNFYEDSVNIRGVKLVYAEGGYGVLMKEVKAGTLSRKKTAVVGGSPAGMVTAYFLARNGLPATIYEQKDSLGGVVKHVIPEFRIADGAIEKDASIVTVYGAEVKYHTTVSSLDGLKAEGYDYIIPATGASKLGVLKLEAGEAVSALDFLAELKAKEGRLDIGSNVVVIGGGNTATDTAKAVKRITGVEHVHLVYRRMKRYMPADAEELEMVVEDGIELKELPAPAKLENSRLLCDVTRLSDMDISGRRGVVKTEEMVEIPADTVIVAVDEQVPTSSYQENGISVSERGKALVNEEILETSREGVFIIDDGLSGPATVVEVMRNVRKVAEAILGKPAAMDFDDMVSDLSKLYDRRGTLVETKEDKEDCTRCLGCSNTCENCVNVYPNRANTIIIISGVEKHQIIHVDYMRNECGNCRSFYPCDSAPYLDKFILFANEVDMKNSKSQGFVVLNAGSGERKVRYLGDIYTCKISDEDSRVPEGLRGIIATVCQDHSYLLG